MIIDVQLLLLVLIIQPRLELLGFGSWSQRATCFFGLSCLVLLFLPIVELEFAIFDSQQHVLNLFLVVLTSLLQVLKINIETFPFLLIAASGSNPPAKRLVECHLLLLVSLGARSSRASELSKRVQSSDGKASVALFVILLAAIIKRLLFYVLNTSA